MDLVLVIRLQPELARELVTDYLKPQCLLVPWQYYRQQVKCLWLWGIGLDLYLNGAKMTLLSEISINSLLN